MGVTYRQQSSAMYNLVQDTKDAGDLQAIARTELTRSSFTRDLGLAANAANIDKTKLIREAMQQSNPLLHKHRLMGNTSTTGGFGGYGYATGRLGVATTDPEYLPYEQALACFARTGHITNPSNYILLSQIVCKPNAVIYARLIKASGVTGSAQWEGVLKTAYDFIVDSYTDTGTIFTGIVGGEFGGTTSAEMPFKLDEAKDYWFVRLYNKTTAKYEIHYMLYDSRPVDLYKGSFAPDTYPNVPLSRNMAFSQTYYDANQSNIQVYPTTAEYEVYMALNKPELDSIVAAKQVQQGFIDAAQAAIEPLLDPLDVLEENKQVEVLNSYLDTTRPALVGLGFALSTYSQADVDAAEALHVATPEAYVDEIAWLYIVKESHAIIEGLIPTTTGFAINHALAETVPYALSEESAVVEMDKLLLRESTIKNGAPITNLVNNVNYSTWGGDTYLKHYPNYLNTLYETFMSKGNPDRESTTRFLAMLGQQPRTYSDVVRTSVQEEVSEGSIATVCDQFVLGCQIRAESDYAEMRYAIEFMRSAWWRSMDDNENSACLQDVFADFETAQGRSAWSAQQVEQTMLNAGNPAMKSMLTRWYGCKVWVEKASLDYGQLGALSMEISAEGSEHEPPAKYSWGHPKGNNPYEIETPAEAELNQWKGGRTPQQTLVGSYNLPDGYVLKVKMMGIVTQLYSKQEGSNTTNSTGLEQPVFPILHSVLSSIPRIEMCQLKNEFYFIRSEIAWRQRKSNWVNFRDKSLAPLIGIVLQVVGVILAIPSGGASLSWSAVGTALMYMAIGHIAMKVLAHFLQQWGIDKTWLGTLVAITIAVVGFSLGMTPTDAVLMSVTVTAQSLGEAYAQVNKEEARAAAGLLASIDELDDILGDAAAELDEEQNWLSLFTASDLVKMREDAVEYIRTETPDKYFQRVYDYYDRMIDLDALDYMYDNDVNLELT